MGVVASPPRRTPWRMAYQLKVEAMEAKQKETMSPTRMCGVAAAVWTDRCAVTMRDGMTRPMMRPVALRGRALRRT